MCKQALKVDTDMSTLLADFVLNSVEEAEKQPSLPIAMDGYEGTDFTDCLDNIITGKQKEETKIR